MSVTASLFRRAFAWALVLEIAFPLVPTRAVAEVSAPAYTGERTPVGVTAAVNPGAAGPFTGEFTHEIAISVPRGAGGLTPSLSLVYASGGGDSAVGVGWSLNVPKLWRSLKHGTPAYDNSDTFVLSGDELVHVDGEPAGTYHKRVESFERILYDDGADTWEVTATDGRVLRFGTDASHRVVNDNNGQTFEWLLAEIEDTHGNVIQYGWVVENGMACLDLIEYTHRTEGPAGALKTINIAYEDRIDSSVSYLAGFEQHLDQLIDKIDVKVGTTLLRRYDLIQEPSPNTQRALLTGIDLYGTDADVGLPTPPLQTLFDYSSNSAADDTLGWETVPTTWDWPLYDWEYEGVGPMEVNIIDTVRFAEVNGDGRIDFIFADSGQTGVYLNSGSGWGPDADLTHALPTSFLGFVYGGGWASGSVALDLTGDGRAELVDAVMHEIGEGDRNAFRATSQGYEAWTGVDLFPEWEQNNNDVFLMLGHLGAYGGGPGNATFADLNGDGFPDIIARGRFDWNDTDYPCSPPLYSGAAYNLGGTAFAYEEESVIISAQDANIPWPMGARLYYPPCLTGPISVDGATYGGFGGDFKHKQLPCDIATDPACFEKAVMTVRVTDVATSCERNFVTGAQYTDLNADGLADFVSRYLRELSGGPEDPLVKGTVNAAFLNAGVGSAFIADDAAWHLPVSLMDTAYLVLGAGCSSITQLASADLGIRVQDLNADGRPDLIQLHPTDGNRIWLNHAELTGAGSHWHEQDTVPASGWTIPAGIAFVWLVGTSGLPPSSPPMDAGVRLVDVDSDGMPDLVHSSAAINDVYLNKGSVPDLLTSVTTPLGATTTLTYGPSTDFDLAHLDADLPFIRQVLTSQSVKYDATDEVVTTFSYEDGLFDVDSQEFRGFGTVIASREDETRTVVYETHYHQEESLEGRIESWVTRDLSGPWWEGGRYGYTDSISDAPYVSLLNRVEHDEYDGECSELSACQAIARTTLTEFEHDLYGNVKSTTEWGEWTESGGDVDPNDTRYTSLGYTAPNLDKYIVDRVAKRFLRIYGTGPDGLRRHTRFYYDGDAWEAMPSGEGNLTKRVVMLDAPPPPVPDPSDPTTTFTYDEYGNLKTVTDPRENAGEGGGMTTFSYDVQGTFVQSVTNALLQATSVGYDADTACDVQYPPEAGLVHLVTGPNDSPGTGRTLCRDVFGRLLSNQAPGDLALTTYAYDDTPRSASVTTTQRTNETGGTAQTTSYLDFVGRTKKTASSGPQGKTVVQEFTFGMNGRLASRSRPDFELRPRRFTNFAYDPLGREITMTLPAVNDEQESNRVYQTTHVKGLVTRTDPLEVEKRTWISPFGQVVAVEEDNSGETYRTEYAYSVTGELELLTDHLGNETDPEWDRAGRKTSLYDPDVGITDYDYYADGSLKSQTDAAGTIVSFDYDPIGRVAWRKIDGVTDFTFDYDAATNGFGRLTKRARATDGFEYQVMEYDLLGRPLEERYQAGGSPHTFTNEYTQAGQLAMRVYPNASELARSFDNAGFLTGIDLEDGVIAKEIEWQATGAPTQWISGDWHKTTKKYHAETGWLKTITINDNQSNMIEFLQYGYTVRDRVKSINALFDANANRDQSFVYDDIGRLTEATGPYEAGYGVQTLRYDYDAIGNLLCKGGGHEGAGAWDPSSCATSGGRTFSDYGTGTTTPRPHAPGQIDGADVFHDALGNLTNRGDKTFGYNALGQLTDVTHDGTPGTPRLTDVQYDFDGRRLSTVDHSSGAPVQRYLITPEYEWVVSADPEFRIHVSLAGTHVATLPTGQYYGGGGCAGTWPAVAVPNLSNAAHEMLILFSPGLFAMVLVLLGGPLRRRIPTLRPAGAVALGTIWVYLFALNGQLFFFGALTREASAAPPAGALFYYSDALGSTSMVTTWNYANGGYQETLGRTVYKPFGEVVPATSGGSTDAPQFGFTSQRYEKAAGIYDYNARWYDPEIGRFLQPDSIVPDPYASQSLNRYSYVMNDPVNYVDPTGHVYLPLPPAWTTAGSIGDNRSGPSSHAARQEVLRDSKDGSDSEVSSATGEGVGIGGGFASSVSASPASGGQAGGIGDEPTPGIENITVTGIRGGRYAAALAIGVRPSVFLGAGAALGPVFLIGAGLIIVVGVGVIVYNSSNEGEGGDDASGYTDSVGKIASETGMTESAVRDAIHRAKAGMGRNTGQRNPDVVVNPKTGDVRPKGPKGKPGDSIGNIFD